MRVLNWCSLEDLRKLRVALLSHAGCEANSPESPLEAILAIHAEPYDVLLLCDQTEPQWADELVRYFRAANPAARIVVLDSIGRNFHFTADIVVEAHNPSALVAAACPPRQSGAVTTVGVR